MIVGSIYELRSEYYHPFSPTTRWFIAPQVGLFTNKFYFYYDNHIDSQYRKRSLAEPSILATLSAPCSAEARLGYQSAYQRVLR